MSIRTSFNLTDNVTPDLFAKLQFLKPEVVARRLLTPLREFWADHVRHLPRHQQEGGQSAGAGPGGFWEGSANDIVQRSHVEGSSVVLEGVGPPNAPGLRLRYLGTQAALGGPLVPKNKKFLVFGVKDESYGKTVYDLGWRPGVKDKALNLRLKGLFAYAKKVTQPPNPDVLPSDDEFTEVANNSLEQWLEQGPKRSWLK